MDNYENLEANFESFSGTNGTFNQELKNSRGFYRANDKKSRATIQIQVENLTSREQVYELFNSNNSIAIQPDDALYSGRSLSGNAWQPYDIAGILLNQAGYSEVPSGSLTYITEDIVAFSRKGSLIYCESSLIGGSPVLFTQISRLLASDIVNTPGIAALKVSMKSTLQGNTYRRLIEKLKTSVLHVTDWKIQCLNEAQFQLAIGQKDFSITGAASDDEFQVSSSVSSKDFNTKIVEITDKQLLIDGDTRLSGIILPNTSMVFTFSVDIINETTKRVF